MSNLLTAGDLRVMLSKADNEYNGIDLSDTAGKYHKGLKEFWQAIDNLAFEQFLYELFRSDWLTIITTSDDKLDNRSIQGIKSIKRQISEDSLSIGYSYHLQLSDGTTHNCYMYQTSIDEAAKRLGVSND